MRPCIIAIQGRFFAVVFMYYTIDDRIGSRKAGTIFMVNQRTKTRTLVECALMIALATVLSYIPLFKLPHGGSITLVSMLPIVVIAFRNGTGWSMLSAFVFSLIQLLLGIQDLTYCQTLGAVFGSVLLDFILGFTVLGLAGVIAKPFKNRIAGVCVGTFVVCVLRYLCSFLSGYIVWKDYDYAFSWMTDFGWGQQIANMGENALCWLYSAVYNGTYMLPEAVITTVAALLLCKFVPKIFAAQQ